jgi:hypothetical protein
MITDQEILALPLRIIERLIDEPLADLLAEIEDNEEFRMAALRRLQRSPE